MEGLRRSLLDLTDEKIHFQGRWETLDWKKIASIDIESILQGSDTSQLLELINSVTFCKAESEFDHGRVDSAFIKVFRLSQLISEYLLLSQERSTEKLTALQEKYNELEKERNKLSQENSQLRESMANAKKELKKRKEMIATTQSEILGQNNGDEYDQCPYCIKKFLTRAYLLAHIQRRHQGLPLPVTPYYPCFHPFGYGGGGEGRLEGAGGSGKNWKRALEKTEANVIQMQDELESRCKSLEQKMKQNERIQEERKNDIANSEEISSFEVVVASASLPSAQADIKRISTPPLKIEDDSKVCLPVGGQQGSGNGKVSEIKVVQETGEVTKSTHEDKCESNRVNAPSETMKRQEMEELKSTLVASVQDEIKSLLTRLESQEQFWQDKLASVQENHEKQIQQLRHELQLQIKPVHSLQILEQNDKGTSCELDQFSSQPRHVNQTDHYHHHPSEFLGPRSLHQIQQTDCLPERNGALRDKASSTDYYGNDRGTNTPRAKQTRFVEFKECHYPEPEEISKVDKPKLQDSVSDLEHEGHEKQEKLTVAPETMKKMQQSDKKSDRPLHNPPKKDPIKEAIVTEKSSFRQDENIQKKSDDELSDCTLSESLLELDQEIQTDSSDDEEALSRSISLLRKNAELMSPAAAMRGMSSAKGKETEKSSKENKSINLINSNSNPSKSLKEVKKAVDLDVEISSGDEFSGVNDDLNWTSADEFDDDSNVENMREREKKKSRLKLIRAKTMSELEKSMNDVGLNPSNNAIGPEEMERALKHLKLKRQISSDQIHDFEKFQRERNSVKSFAKFEATKSSIDEKLDEICSQNLKRPDKTSYVRIFSAVRASGKKFKNILPFTMKH